MALLKCRLSISKLFHFKLMLKLFFSQPESKKEGTNMNQVNFSYEFLEYRFNCYISLQENIQIQDEAERLSVISGKYNLQQVLITTYLRDLKYEEMFKKYSRIIFKEIGKRNRFPISIKILNHPLGSCLIEPLIKCHWIFINDLQLESISLSSDILILLVKQKYQYLTHLNVKNNRICPEGIKYLTYQQFKYLKNLNLSCNPIGNKGVKLLCKGSKWSKLQVLNLEKINATKHVFGYLKKMTKGSSVLKINLVFDNISMAAFQHVPLINSEPNRLISVQKARKPFQLYEKYNLKKFRNTIAKIDNLPIRIARYKAFMDDQKNMFDCDTVEEDPQITIQEFTEKLYYYSLQNTQSYLITFNFN